MVGLLVASALLLGAMAAYAMTLHHHRRRFREMILPPDDLRRADDGLDRAPDDSPSGGWV